MRVGQKKSTVGENDDCNDNHDSNDGNVYLGQDFIAKVNRDMLLQNI